MRTMLEYETLYVYVLASQRNKVVNLKEIFQDYWDKEISSFVIQNYEISIAHQFKSADNIEFCILIFSNIFYFYPLY